MTESLHEAIQRLCAVRRNRDNVTAFVTGLLADKTTPAPTVTEWRTKQCAAEYAFQLAAMEVCVAYGAYLEHHGEVAQ